MASSSSLDRFKRTTSGGDTSLETIEMDPQYASGLGLQSGDVVSFMVHCFTERSSLICCYNRLKLDCYTTFLSPTLSRLSQYPRTIGKLLYV